MRLFRGDNLDHLQFEDSDSIDAVVTDPPYGLSFMGKKWDYDVPGVELWREVLRVLKPGGHLLAFGGTRTYHRLAVNIEDAGFEIRDQVMWIYGSGFPKSLDVSKAIDKAAGAEREVIGINSNVANRTENSKSCIDPKWAEQDTRGKGFLRNDSRITAPATDSAKRWQGWGTALKPANEPIVLARKPIEKGLTVAENVLKWGVGALNIDGTRIAGKPRTTHKDGNFQSKSVDGNLYKHGLKAGVKLTKPQGRWPANVLFDEDAAAVLDEQSGLLKNRANKSHSETSKDDGFALFGKGMKRQSGAEYNYGTDGGASRFFYVAKTSKRERNAGLEGMPERVSSKVGQTVWTNECQECGKSPPQTEKRCGSCDGELARVDREKPSSLNHHPTVKPIKLMEYLIKLITPPGGIVLDPFMGSGSTGCAAKKLKRQFIGIELDKEYFEIAKKRINHI